MYEQILVPTDGSDGAGIALEEALELASTHDATVHVLSVVEPVYTGDAGTHQVIEALETAAEQTVSEARAEIEARDIAVRTDIQTGSPHRVILEYVDENDIDLVVMGTQGRTGLERYLIGSVTEKVVRLSPVPVLTIRAVEPDESAEAAE